MKKIFQTIRNLFRVKQVHNMEFVEACKRIIANGTCQGASVYCQCSYSPDNYVKCPNYGKPASKSWSCVHSVESSHMWLVNHGIKE